MPDIQHTSRLFFVGGPSACAYIHGTLAEVENIIEKWCHLTWDDEYEYTCTSLPSGTPTM